MFPLGTVLLPGERLPLQIFEPRYVALVKACLAAPGDPQFGVVLITRGHEVGGGDQRTDVGTVARIESCTALPGNRYGLIGVGDRRIRVRRWLTDDPYPRAEVEPWPDDLSEAVDDAVVEQANERTQELDRVWRELAAKSGGSVPDFREPVLPTDPSAHSFALASSLPIGDTDRQRVLAAPGPAQRLATLVDALDDVIAGPTFSAVIRTYATEAAG